MSTPSNAITLRFDKSLVQTFREPQSMHPEENGAVADRFRKAKMLDHDVAVREPEETGRRSRFCEAKILTLPIFSDQESWSGCGVKLHGF